MPSQTYRDCSRLLLIPTIFPSYKGLEVIRKKTSSMNEAAHEDCISFSKQTFQLPWCKRTAKGRVKVGASYRVTPCWGIHTEEENEFVSIPVANWYSTTKRKSRGRAILKKQSFYLATQLSTEEILLLTSMSKGSGGAVTLHLPQWSLTSM